MSKAPEFKPKDRLEVNLNRLRQFRAMTDRPANDIPARRSLAKGKVRLRWDHRPSINVSQYRIDKVAERTLKTYRVNPVFLGPPPTPAELRIKAITTRD